jgi:hypothetical protein
MIWSSKEWYKLIIILYEYFVIFPGIMKKVFRLQIRGIRVQILQRIDVIIWRSNKICLKGASKYSNVLNKKYLTLIVNFAQALEGREYIMMLGHRFPPFCNTSQYATSQKSNFWQQKWRMWCKIVSVQIFRVNYRIIFTTIQ